MWETTLRSIFCELRRTYRFRILWLHTLSWKNYFVRTCTRLGFLHSIWFTIHFCQLRYVSLSNSQASHAELEEIFRKDTHSIGLSPRICIQRNRSDIKSIRSDTSLKCVNWTAAAVEGNSSNLFKCMFDAADAFRDRCNEGL